MSRRHRAEKREILPDAKYGDKVLSKFMNNLMLDGKKSAAERIVYGALDRVEDKTKRAPVEVFHEALETSNQALRFVLVVWVVQPTKFRLKCVLNVVKHWPFAG